MPEPELRLVAAKPQKYISQKRRIQESKHKKTGKMGI
jgi:hypothetical protein